jgi:hypothetical protein
MAHLSPARPKWLRARRIFYARHQQGASNCPQPVGVLSRQQQNSWACTVRSVKELQAGPPSRFADWPSGQVPRRAAGVYTVWQADELIYAGMSGRGAHAEDFVAYPGQPGKAIGLWTRLNSHASGRRSADQFNIYVCDRFVVPALTPGQQRDIGRGRLLLDQLTRAYIAEHLSYRFQIYRDGTCQPF